MKCLFLLNGMPSMRGSIEMDNYKMIKALTNAGHTCHIIGISPTPEITLKETAELLPDAKILECFPQNSNLRRNWNRLIALLAFRAPAVYSHYNKKMAKLLHKAVKSESYDIIFYSLISATAYKKPHHIPSILGVTDAMSLALQRRLKYYKNPLKRLYEFISYRSILRIERKKFHQHDAVVLVSNADKAYLEQQNQRANYQVIPISVDSRYFMQIDKNKRNILFFGGNMQMPGIADGLFEFLDGAFQKIADHVKDFEFVVKTWNTSEEQKERIRRYPVVHNDGHVAEYWKLLEQPKVAIAPDKLGTGLKNRVLQYFAAGIPVVGSDFSLEGFQLTDDIHAFRSNTADDAAEKVIRLFENESLYESMASAAQALARDAYSEEAIGKQWVELFEQAVSHKSDKS